MQARVAYAPESDWAHGSVPLSWSWQQTMLNFEVAAIDASSESAARSAHADLLEAVTQWAFLVTTTVSDSPAETWTCHPGSVTPGGPRSYVDLRHFINVWVVTVPCYPVRAVGA
jgi:hypothetical protein